MAKKYFPNETKEQRKKRKRIDKGLILLKNRALTTDDLVETNLNVAPNLSDDTRYVVCLKHGNKYGADYVNNLHRMVKRNLTLEYTFVCFTEDAKGIDNDIKIMPLPALPVQGWWYKPMFFDPDLGLKGTILFMDLDLIVFRNIDNLFTYEPDKFCIIRDFNRMSVRNYKKMNSSVFRLNTGQCKHVYTDFIKDPKLNSRRFHGDQDWIFAKLVNSPSQYEYWPDEWIQSYKWEMRGKPQMTRDTKGKRNFAVAGTPKILPQTSIAVFHGDPNPHNCIDEWCKQNWR